MEFKKIVLPYALDALQPYLSEKQMDFHYNKHHSAYEKKFNDVIAKTENKDTNLENIVKNYLKFPKEYQVDIRQFGGGLINHNFFFAHLAKDKPIHDSLEISQAITETFGSFEIFKEKFNKFAMGVFGSGWTWLAITQKGELRIYNTYNQDTPWFIGMTPIMCIDVWEHAYYIDYFNDRKKFIDAFWSIINWEVVEHNYKNFLKHNTK